MAENSKDGQNKPTNGSHSEDGKKRTSLTKIKRKKKKSEGKSKSTKKNSGDVDWNPNPEDLRAQKDRTFSNGSDQKNQPHRVRTSLTLTDGSSEQPGVQKEQRGSRKNIEKPHSSNKFAAENTDRTASTGEYEEKETNRSSSRLLGNRAQDSNGRKEDSRPCVPPRGSDRQRVCGKSMDKPPSKPKKRTSSIKKQKSDDEMDTYISDDKQPEKPKRKSRVSPKNNIEDEHDDDLGLRTFHNLRIDSDKPKSKNSRTRKKATSGERSSGRRKEKAPDRSKSLPAGQNTESSDDVGSTSEVDVEDEGNIQPERMRSSRERRNNQKRLDSNDSFRNSGKVDTINSNDTRVSRSSHSLRRSGVRRSRSERWNKAVEIMDSDGTDDHHSINRRAQESLNRVNDGFSRSGHSRIRRHHSAGLTKMSRSMRSYSHHDIDYKRLNSIDGKRSSRRAMRHRHETDSEESFLDDNIDTATLESIDDEYEDYEEDVYRMELQTPGMIDFEEEMFDLMQRANPEVTDHLDRRVHRKREMVAFDHNMPMMTRQALLTRQASSRLRRQFLDGSNVDKKRLLLRNDSMSSSDGLAMSNHRQMRSAHKRRVPPRAKSSGLGGMGRVGYSDSFKSDSVDRRGAFRSQSIHGSHPASFNQYYQNKPNRIRSLSRRASGDLINPHSMRGSSRPNSQLAHQRAIQRTTSSTSRRRSASSDQTLSRKQDSKIYTEKNQRSSNRRVFPDEDQDTDNFDEQLEHEISKGNSSTSSFLTEKSNGSKNFDKNDMANKRNRSKLHLLLYKTKMAIDMDVLLRKVRKGDTPRLPIDSLRMPSP